MATSTSPSKVVPDGAADGIIRTVELTKVYAGTDFAAVDASTSSSVPGDLRAPRPNGRARPRRRACSPREWSDVGHAFVSDIDVVAHPTLTKQLIGVVSSRTRWTASSTSGRTSTSRAPLRHVRQGLAPERGRALGTLPARQWAKASVYALSGGMASG